jgi:Na+-translocating ferredoxin:NAD+ oxidoreductase subunit B
MSDTANKTSQVARSAVDQQLQRIAEIDACLPQTQCTRCGYSGCLPYAQAIAEGAPINQCPPGGAETLQALAQVLGLDAKTRAALTVNPEHGQFYSSEQPRTLAWIVEADCIGCTKCIQVCPTDAIFGASKQMHTVLHSECVSCGLCVPACPVDCIEMRVDYLGRDAAGTWQSGLGPRQTHDTAERDHARMRFSARAARQQRLAQEQAERHAKILAGLKK